MTDESKKKKVKQNTAIFFPTENFTYNENAQSLRSKWQ